MCGAYQDHKESACRASEMRPAVSPQGLSRSAKNLVLAACEPALNGPNARRLLPLVEYETSGLQW